MRADNRDLPLGMIRQMTSDLHALENPALSIFDSCLSMLYALAWENAGVNVLIDLDKSCFFLNKPHLDSVSLCLYDQFHFLVEFNLQEEPEHEDADFWFNAAEFFRFQC